MPWLETESVASADGDVELVPLDAATTLAEAET
jgi:hypothetical protein